MMMILISTMMKIAPKVIWRFRENDNIATCCLTQNRMISYLDQVWSFALENKVIYKVVW